MSGESDSGSKKISKGIIKKTLMTETLSIQTWALIGAIIFLIIMIGFAVSKTFSDEAVFYSSYFDLFLSFVPVIAFLWGGIISVGILVKKVYLQFLIGILMKEIYGEV